MSKEARGGVLLFTGGRAALPRSAEPPEPPPCYGRTPGRRRPWRRSLPSDLSSNSRFGTLVREGIDDAAVLRGGGRRFLGVMRGAGGRLSAMSHRRGRRRRGR